VTYLEELQDVIHKLHGVHSTHLQSVPVTEKFEGKVIWDGVVEVSSFTAIPKLPMLTHGVTKLTTQSSPSAA